jgi:cell division protease FtsH
VTRDGHEKAVTYFSTKLGVVDSKTEETWASKGMSWSYKDSETMWTLLLYSILPWVLIFGLFMFMMRRMQNGGPKGIFSFGKSRARLLNETGANRVTFADVAGADEAKYELEEVIEFLKEPSKFQSLAVKFLVVYCSSDLRAPAKPSSHARQR